MNNNMLISTAMLNAYWEKQKKDTIDLLIPFVKYSIAKTTSVGKVIDTTKLIEHFRNEFGYDTVPSNVMYLILNRLSPNIVDKIKRDYYLKVSLDDDVTKFEKGHMQFMERYSKVANSLKRFLNDNLSLRNPYDEDKAMQALIEFFATNGICIIRDSAFLELLKKKDDALKYCIAQFILNESNKKTEIFGYIEDMVKGFFVSTAISLQPQNPSVAQSKFKGLKCYIDTRLIIDALGMHLTEAKEAALELLNMLKEKGAELCCFEHNYQEIKDIIAAYKNGLKNPYNNYSHQTLEGWDAQNYTVTDVERYQKLLFNRINDLGIDIVPKPAVNDVSKYPFNDSDLISYVEERATHYKRDALETDIKSVASILLLKDGNHSAEIEKSEVLFVTSNVYLARVVNAFLRDNDICDPENEAMPIITDIDLSSIVWLKCCETHKDYPKQRLIEHAITALEPTPSMLNTFYEIVDRILAEGGITEDEASIIRLDAFCRKELVISIKGNLENITEQTIYDIKDKVRAKYIGIADEESKLNYQKYVQERERNRTMILNALKKVKNKTDKAYKWAFVPLFSFACIILATIICVFVLMSIKSDFTDSKNSIIAIILFIFSVLGTVDMFVSKWHFVLRFIRYIAREISIAVGDKKKAEYIDILGNISYDMLE